MTETEKHEIQRIRNFLRTRTKNLRENDIYNKDERANLERLKILIEVEKALDSIVCRLDYKEEEK